MFSTLRPISVLRSSLLRPRNASVLSVSSALSAYRFLSTSRVNRAESQGRFVYLSNLPWTLEIEDIKNKAEQFGPLQSINMPDDPDGRPGGFANVEFASAEDAAEFVQASKNPPLTFGGRIARAAVLNEPQTTKIRVPRESSVVSPSGPTRTIFVGGLPRDIQQEDVQQTFAPFGTLTRVNIAKDPYGQSRGFGHISFERLEDAEAAMNAFPDRRAVIVGQTVALDFAEEKRRETDPPSNKLYFSQFDGTSEDLREVLVDFEPEIVNVIMLRNRNGIIEFKSIDAATKAKDALHGTETRSGHSIMMFYSNPRPTRDGPARSNTRRSNSYGGDW